jgi:hypothetical protein
MFDQRQMIRRVDMTTFHIWMLILTGISGAGALSLFGVVAIQIYYYRKELRYRSIIDMATAHRETLKVGIDRPELLKVFQKETNLKEERVSRYAQMWINHAHAIWYRYDIGLMDKRQWEPVKNDMLQMFDNPVVRRRWKDNRLRYHTGFQEIIDRFIGKPVRSKTLSQSE